MKNENRRLSSIAAKVGTNEKKNNTLILTSSTDVGVRLNNGRDGSRLGPKSLCYHFYKMNNHLTEVTGIKEVEVSEIEEEKTNFKNSQKLEALKISKNLESDYQNIIHLGGGHDHVYPLLLSLQELKNYKRLLIINIDAHCDTRIDALNHSGTPFRNFDHDCKIETKLIQFGIHKYANSEETLSHLKTIDQKVVFQNETLSLDLSIYDNDESLVLLSLDADGLDSSIMRAVSAVNTRGVSMTEVFDIIKKIKNLQSRKVFGIYEYNPKFDDLSNQGAKTLAHLIYNWLE